MQETSSMLRIWRKKKKFTQKNNFRHLQKICTTIMNSFSNLPHNYKSISILFLVFFSLYIFTKKLSIFLPQKIEKILWWILIIYNTKRFIVLYCENENKKVVIKTKLYETCQGYKIIVNEGIIIHFLFFGISSRY